MALDSNILNATAHPQKLDVYDPMELADLDSKRQNLGAMAQQKQLRDQQIQENAIKLQAQQQVQEDQAKFADLYRQNSGDMDKALAAAPAAGINPAFISDATKANQAAKIQYAQMTEAARKQQAEHANRLMGRMDAVLAAPTPEAQAAAYGQQVREGIASGDIKPGEIPDTFPGIDALKSLQPVLLGHSAYLKQADEAAKQARDTTAAATAAAEAPGKIEKANNDAIISGLGVASRTVGSAVTPAPPPAAAPPPAPGTAPLPAAPLVTRGPGDQKSFDTVVDAAKKQYPFIGKINPVLVNSDKKGGEGWPSGEEGDASYPRPSSIPLGRHGVEVGPDSTPADLAGEVLHVDPVAIAAREKLTKSLTPAQIEYLKKESLDYGTADDGSGMSDESRLRNAVDSAMRGTLLGQWPKEAVDGLALTDEQKKGLGQLKSYMKTGKESGVAASLSDDAQVSPEQAQWNDFISKYSPSVQKLIPKTYSPEAVKQVQRMGLTGYQATEAEAREQRAKRLAAIPGKNIAELAQIANNEDLPIEERDLARKALADIKAQKVKAGGGGSKPLSEPQLRVLKNEHDTAYRNEQDQWTLAGQLGDVSSVKDDEKFYNPASKKEMTMNPQIRQLLKSQYEAARRKATEYQQEGRDIRAKLGGPTGDEGGKAPATQVVPGPPPKGAKFKIGQPVWDKQGKEKKVLGYDAQGKVVTD